jgi:hypothetical protein
MRSDESRRANLYHVIQVSFPVKGGATFGTEVGLDVTAVLPGTGKDFVRTLKVNVVHGKIRTDPEH